MRGGKPKSASFHLKFQRDHEQVGRRRGGQRGGGQRGKLATVSSWREESHENPAAEETKANAGLAERQTGRR